MKSSAGAEDLETTKIRDFCIAAAAASEKGALAAGLAATARALWLAEQGATPDQAHHAHALALTADGWLRFEVGDDTLARSRFNAAVALARRLADLDPEHALAVWLQASRFYRRAGTPADVAMAKALEWEGLAIVGAWHGLDHPRYFQWQAVAEAGNGL